MRWRRPWRQAGRWWSRPRGLPPTLLGASRLGELSYGILAQTGARSVLVEDRDIVAAQAWLWDNLRLITEPGGATALAPLLSAATSPTPKSGLGW